MSRRDVQINRIINANARHMKAWLKHLCDTKEKMEDFIHNFLDTKCLWDSLCTFQVHLKMSGLGQSITLEDLQECIDTGDDTLLKLTLQDLLLIPVSDKALEVFKKRKDLKEFMKLTKEYSKIPIIDFTGESFEIAYYRKTKA